MAINCLIPTSANNTICRANANLGQGRGIELRQKMLSPRVGNWRTLEGWPERASGITEHGSESRWVRGGLPGLASGNSLVRQWRGCAA